MNRTVIGIAICLVLLICLAGSAFFYMIFFGMSSKRDIAENVQVSSEWTELAVESPLKIQKQVQEITLVVDGARVSADKESKISLPSGAVIKPEVELKDRNGTWHPLKSASFSIEGYDSNSDTHAAKSIGFWLGSDRFSPDEVFVAVRLRSGAEPFVSRNVAWHVFYLK